MERDEAEKLLKCRFGIKHFHNEQWEVISRLLVGDHRILMIERTGYGKSLCYQFPATVFSGITVVFSPLIALMRDQVQSLSRLGIPAGCINSEQSQEENDAIIAKAESNRIKILYITPERQENRNWMQSIIEGKIDISMVVIDEAHTVSVWGHDFRPAFRKIIHLVKRIGIHRPVLATTATATLRVQEDIRNQIGGDVEIIRGNLVRDNFRLYVINVKSEEEKMIWLRNNLHRLDGTGIIYAGTRAQSETYANWLSFSGINCTHYNAGLDPLTRKDIEAGLMENRWKCIISTNALGMGLDKPDIRFVIHLQAPASPIHYYQEIGRAGRDGKPTDAILFYNSSIAKDGIETDLHLPLAFINGARPERSKYEKTVNLVRSSEIPLRQRDILLGCNLKSNEFRIIKEDLIEQGIIREVVYGKSKIFEPVPGDKPIDYSSFDAVRDAKLKDLDAMAEYIHTDSPRMRFLCNFLGDDEPSYNRNCDNTTLQKQHVSPTAKDMELISCFRDEYFPEKEIKIRNAHSIIIVAASYYGTSSVGDAIHRSKYENGGDFPDFLVKMTLKAYYKKLSSKNPDCILYVPPTVSGDLVKNFAHMIGKALNLPVFDWITKTRQTEEQKVFRNSYGKNDNVKDAFMLNPDGNVTGKTVLLIDDIFDSGNTIKEISSMLFNAGASDIAPLVIARTVSNDL